MPHSRAEALGRICFLAYGLLFGALLFGVLFFNTAFDYRPALTLALMAAWGGVLFAALLLWRRRRDWLLRRRRRILLLLLAGIFAVQLAVSLSTVPNPMYDHGKVFHGAVAFATEGDGAAFALYDGYLHRYPNNMGLFLLLQLLFRALDAVGLDCFYLAACVVGQLLFALMLAAGFCYLDETAGGDCALFFLLLAALFPPIYFQASVSYTDTYSVWAAPCVLLCTERAVRAESAKRRLALAALAGACLGVGGKIKVTVLIVGIALAIWLLAALPLRRALAGLAAAGAVFAAVWAGFGLWGRALVLDDPARDGEALPATHWIMMGMQGDGSYNSYDEWFITTTAPYDERVATNLRVIRERLEQMGPAGYLRLLWRKSCRTFGSGTADMSYSYQYQDNSPPAGWVYELVLENGRFYTLYNNLSQSAYLTLTALGVAGAFLTLRRRGEGAARFAPPLALCGFWLFMMLWESNHRQLVNQWSLWLILAAEGLFLLAQCRRPIDKPAGER